MPYAGYDGLRPQVNTPYEAVWSLDEAAYKAYKPMEDDWSLDDLKKLKFTEFRQLKVDTRKVVLAFDALIAKHDELAGAVGAIPDGELSEGERALKAALPNVKAEHEAVRNRMNGECDRYNGLTAFLKRAWEEARKRGVELHNATEDDVYDIDVISDREAQNAGWENRSQVLDAFSENGEVAETDVQSVGELV
jgi:hypothetical protein